jgi:hypothetical protein
LVSLSDAESIKYGEEKCVYAILSKVGISLCKISQKLLLQITEIDIDSKDELGSYEEDYNLEDLVIAVRDYIKPYALPTG